MNVKPPTLCTIAVTVIGPDRTGIVRELADAALAHEANWMESHMANLAGQFAGIVELELPTRNLPALEQAFERLQQQQLSITTVRASRLQDTAQRDVTLALTGIDHPGIVRDITAELAIIGVSVQELETTSGSASMSGEQIFRATARLRAPLRVSMEAIDAQLQRVACDLMVDLVLDEAESP